MSEPVVVAVGKQRPRDMKWLERRHSESESELRWKPCSLTRSLIFFSSFSKSVYGSSRYGLEHWNVQESSVLLPLSWIWQKWASPLKVGAPRAVEWRATRVCGWRWYLTPVRLSLRPLCCVQDNEGELNYFSCVLQKVISEHRIYFCSVSSTSAFWSWGEKLKDKTTKYSLENIGGPGWTGEQGLEGEGWLVMTSPSLLGNRPWTVKSFCSQDGFTVPCSSWQPSAENGSSYTVGFLCHVWVLP